MLDQQTVFRSIASLTGQANILTVPRAFIAFTGDIETALLLSQLLYWTPRATIEGGWIAKTYPQWEEEIGLSEYQVRRSWRKLQRMGLVETCRRKFEGNPTVHYRLHSEEFTASFLEFLQKRSCKDNGNVPAESPATILKKPQQPLQRLPTETTTKTTAAQKATTNKKEALPTKTTAAAPSLVEALIAEDVNRGDAERLAQQNPEECERQLSYLPYRNRSALRNRGAYLRKAIEDGYAPPDAYREAQEQRTKAARLAAVRRGEAARQAHQARHQEAYHAYLRSKMQAIKRTLPEVYAEFLLRDAQMRGFLEEHRAGRVAQAALAAFDTEAALLQRFLNLFEQRAGFGVLSFWQWDAEINPEAFSPGGRSAFRV